MAMRTLRAKGEAGEERRIIMDGFFLPAKTGSKDA